MFKKSLLALSGLVLWTAAETATAEDASINSMSYDTQAVFEFNVINVWSSDGQEWDTFAGKPVKFSANMEVDARWPGYVRFA